MRARGRAQGRPWGSARLGGGAALLATGLAATGVALVATATGCATPGSTASAVSGTSESTDAPRAVSAERPASRWDGLESVRAFDAVVATMLELRDTVLADAVTEREAAEGMRFVLRALAMGESVTGEGYPPAPHFARMDTPRRKIGGDNPDGEYDNLVWDGRIPYRIDGNRGSVDHLSFTVLSALPNGRQKAIGYLNERDLELDADGDFTIWLTPEKPDAPGSWIRTGPEAGVGTMLVRQYFGDRSAEVPATYSVSVVGRERYDPLPPSTDAEIAAGLRGTIRALRGLGWLHRYVSPSLGENANGFKRSNSDDFGADISSLDNLYVIGHYDFGPEEALLIEVEPMDVRFWNLAIENPWHESVDYAVRRTSRTHDEVSVDPDGLIRFVVAHAPTDHPNHLETAGHRRGFMTFRWVGERDTRAPLPRIERLPLAEALATARARGGR